jgi:hypothetical protein
MKTFLLTLCAVVALSASVFADPYHQTFSDYTTDSKGVEYFRGIPIPKPEQADDFALEQDQCLWYALAFAEHHHGSWLLFFEQPGQHQGHAMVFWQAPGMTSGGYVYDNMHPHPILVNSGSPIDWINQLYPNAFYTEFKEAIDFDHMTNTQKAFLQYIAHKQLAAD